MQQVGVRELKQNASAVLRRVKEGETIEVTERGRRVARLTPIREGNRLDQLIAEGRARAAVGSLQEFLADHPPVPAKPGVPLPSEILADMRADER